MLLTLHNLAERYKCLPSEALQRATTLDLYILDISTRWHNKQTQETGGADPEPKLSTEEMMAMIRRTRGEQ